MSEISLTESEPTDHFPTQHTEKLRRSMLEDISSFYQK